MKWIHLLFIAGIVLLPLYPCLPGDRCTDEGWRISEMTDSDAEDDASGHCSPSCLCACCLPIMQIAALVELPLPGIQHDATPSTYIERVIAVNSRSIWQPPKPPMSSL